MPVITVTMGKGQMNSDQKEKLIHSFTESAVGISNLPEQAFTILISELADENIGVGGKTLKDIKQNKN